MSGTPGSITFGLLALAGVVTDEEADELLARMSARVAAEQPSGVAAQIRQELELIRAERE